MIPLTRIRLPSSSPAMSVLVSWLKSVAHTHATVDWDDRTGDVTRILGRQEADNAGDLGGGANPLRRDEFQCPRLDPLIQPARHIGVDVARGYHIRSHVGLRHLPGDRAGHADHTGLGGCVISLVADAPGAGDRAYED